MNNLNEKDIKKISEILKDDLQEVIIRSFNSTREHLMDHVDKRIDEKIELKEDLNDKIFIMWSWLGMIQFKNFSISITIIAFLLIILLILNTL